ncbi:hypothetical protein H5410_061563 [Solanum commersonii]|uniref:Uncharacterized protein n=1 Tax=Solanum commersonii TaxID=4109 RepID=A0A9J5W869_SOLCO|nr:hypothetical protein H5410_061563 [Solanum commersonii]
MQQGSNTKQRDQVTAIWDRVILTTEYGSPMESTNSKKSWADEVEDEANALGKKKSIWDDFDIAKLANAGHKLEYVTPTKKGEIVEIEMEDIRSEITYWGNVMVLQNKSGMEGNKANVGGQTIKKSGNDDYT